MYRENTALSKMSYIDREIEELPRRFKALNFSVCETVGIG